MAKSLSILKRDRQNEKRRLRNKSRRKKVFTYFKKVNTALEESKSEEEVMKAYRDWQKALDKIAGKGTIHKNTAARRKSRMYKKIRSKFSK